MVERSPSGSSPKGNPLSPIQIGLLGPETNLVPFGAIQEFLGGSMIKSFWGVSLTVALVLALSLSSFGQGSTAVYGNLAGVITDSTGAVVPGAKVTAIGPTGNRSVTSEQDGRFTLPSLSPGTYSLKVEKQGFRAADVKGVEIVINRTS